MRTCASLARRLAGTRVTANCFHPGFVATRYGDNAGGLLAYGVRIAKLFAISSQKGAQTLVWLATSPEVANATGGYYTRRALKTSSEAGRGRRGRGGGWTRPRGSPGSGSPGARFVSTLGSRSFNARIASPQNTYSGTRPAKVDRLP